MRIFIYVSTTVMSNVSMHMIMVMHISEGFYDLQNLEDLKKRNAPAIWDDPGTQEEVVLQPGRAWL